MAKRHHSGKHMGGSYEGMDERRRQERQDGSMLNDSHSSVANMPQDVKYHAWPSAQNHFLGDGDLDDTIRGVDHQVGELDGAKGRKHRMPKKV